MFGEVSPIVEGSQLPWSQQEKLSSVEMFTFLTPGEDWRAMLHFDFSQGPLYEDVCCSVMIQSHNPF
jgi:hypothetical protein